MQSHKSPRWSFLMVLGVGGEIIAVARMIEGRADWAMLFIPAFVIVSELRRQGCLR